jgi:hypothetical protein
VQRLRLAAADARLRRLPRRRLLLGALLELRLDEVAHEPIELAVNGFGDELLKAAVHLRELVVHLPVDELGEIQASHNR